MYKIQISKINCKIRSTLLGLVTRTLYYLRNSYFPRPAETDRYICPYTLTNKKYYIVYKRSGWVGFGGSGGSGRMLCEWLVGQWIVGVISFQKKFGAYGLKGHIVEKMEQY